MIIVNPEFHRYLWLKFSPFRLIVMPIVLGLVLYIASNTDDLVVDVWQASLFIPALYTFFVVVFLWGGYEAASASNSDVGMNTWDFQKMSALGPWDIVIGKLFGSTSYTWYAGLLLLGVILFSYPHLEAIGEMAELKHAFPSAISLVMYLVFAGVMGHATAFLFGTQNLRQKKSGAGIPFILGFIVSSTVFSLTIGGDLDARNINSSETVSWHIWEVSSYNAIIGSLVFFLFWIIIAIQRNIREELQFRNSPIALIAFLVTFSLYVTGFLDNFNIQNRVEFDEMITIKCIFAFFIISFGTYFTVFMEAASLAKYRRWIYALKEKEWKRVFENTPGWAGALLVLTPLYLVANVGTEFYFDEGFPGEAADLSIFALTTAILLFTARDGLMFHSILLGRVEKHKGFLLILYFVMAYGLLPFFVASTIDNMDISGTVYDDTMFNALLYFYPLGGDSFITGCLPVLGQVIIAFVVFRVAMSGLKAKDAN